MILFMVVAAVAACGLLRVARWAVPPRIDLADAVARFDQARQRASRGSRTKASSDVSLSIRSSAWLADLLERRGSDLTSMTRDLAITDSTLEDHLSKTVTLAGEGLLGPVAIVIVLNAAGLGLPYAIGPLLGVVLGSVMPILAHRELNEAADKRRAQFRHTLSIYLDLVAMSMQAGRGHSEALPASAAIGTGWGFTQLQDAIEGARFSGLTPWRALGQLGERLGVRELTDLEGALALANDDGAKIRSTLVARAETLRSQRIADAEADATRATESMKFALIVMVFGFLTYELYPSIVRLFAG